MCLLEVSSAAVQIMLWSLHASPSLHQGLFRCRYAFLKRQLLPGDLITCIAVRACQLEYNTTIY